jgi:hypothetical protein
LQIENRKFQNADRELGRMGCLLTWKPEGCTTSMLTEGFGARGSVVAEANFCEFPQDGAGRDTPAAEPLGSVLAHFPMALWIR